MNSLRLNEKYCPIFWNTNFLNDSEIENIMRYSRSLEFVDGLVGDLDNYKEKNKNTLKSHVKEVDRGNVPRIRQSSLKWIKNNETTKWLYHKIIKEIHRVNQENFNYILKFVEDLQFTEYNEKEQGFYAIHNDCGFDTSPHTFVDIRKLSFSIQLTDPCEYDGCELLLYPELTYQKDTVVKGKKNKGSITFFESKMMHEVTPIKKGIRQALVGWVQGPNIR